MSDIQSLNAALVGRYEIVREIGAGGMATVWLAEDVKHHRKVAIKVLKPELSVSVGATRFVREIEIAAQLQHPNILPLLDSGSAAGALYYVMPFVEGQSLRQRLARERELPIGETVRLLIEVVDALAYAHQQGVVHRDMKPDNVMITGRHALVADFGVARALSEASGTVTLTSHGVALGTPSYMAPEQAVADPNVDQRADIYAVGIMAYEMLTGQPPFTGITPQQVLAAQVTEQPTLLSKHRPGVSAALEQLVMRCLEKRPADRWQSADELLAALEPLATPSGGMQPTAARLSAVARPRRVPWLAVGAAVLALVAVGGGAAWMRWRAGPAQLAIGKQALVTTESGLNIQPALSPDGQLVAYAAGDFARMRIFVRQVDGGRTIALSDDSTAVEFAPRWSPDGRRLLYLAHGGVSVAPALGGGSHVVVPASGGPGVVSATWSPDGSTIAFARGDSLFAIPVDGGAPRLIARVSDVYACDWGAGGRWIACATGNSMAEVPGSRLGNVAPSGVIIVPASGGTPVTVAEPSVANASPVWSPRGDRLFFVSNRDGVRDIYAVDVGSSGRPRGVVTRLTTGLGAMSITMSHDGRRLGYAVYSARSNLWSLPIPQRGPAAIASATPVTTGRQVIEFVRVSKDGRWLLFDSDRRGSSHIWRMPMSGGEPEQLTDGPADEFAPDLSPDGRWVAYHSWRTGTRDIEVKGLNGGQVERVTATPGQESYPVWSPDGKSLMFFDQVTSSSYVTTRGSGGRWMAPRLVVPGVYPEWSPDGRAIAYLKGTLANFIFALCVKAVDSGPEKVLLSPADSVRPEQVHWARDGRTIYFKAHDRLGRASFWGIPVSGGVPQLVARLDDLSHPSGRADFAVDSTHLYYAVQDRTSDVFVAEVIAK